MPAAARIPAATYRLQLGPGCGFAAAQDLVPYLHALGITDLYASPVLQARRGSQHGYDVTDPTRLNPALGTAAAFDGLCRALRERDMGLLLDIVPNHMAASAENPWWRDVLESGPASPWAAYFDIDWHPGDPDLENRLLLPILGAPLAAVLQQGELRLAHDRRGLHLRYHEHELPVDPGTWGLILTAAVVDAAAGDAPAHGPGDTAAGLAALLRRAAALPPRNATDPRRVRHRHREKEAIKGELWRLCREEPAVRHVVDAACRQDDAERLSALLGAQAYLPAPWQEGNTRINYRRFFAVSDLAALRAEDARVFAATHALVQRLVRSGRVTGLRIDHIDGLQDPLGYLRRLQAALRSDAEPPFYVVVEKILSGDETLPADWPVHGTTGYEFLNALNAVFVPAAGLAALDDLYHRLVADPVPFPDLVHAQKQKVIRNLFGGEMAALGRHLARLAARDPRGRALPAAALRAALAEVTAWFPVYRTYIRSRRVAVRDRAYIEQALAQARRHRPDLGPAYDFLAGVLLVDLPGQLPPALRSDRLRFLLRWQQFTGPIMAKGVEDTALYIYNRLISLNAVGSEPGSVGDPVPDFHRHNAERLRCWPYGLITTSTHDSKRSEDVRARINVLSEMPTAWSERLQRWRRWNQDRRPVVRGVPVPDANTELLLYQTLVGAWPLDPAAVPAFVRERLPGYMLKAAREAKVHTSWLHPDPDYHRALLDFVAAILDDDNPFLADFLAFQRLVAFYGASNALAQVVLKVAAPGVPDFYQGTELWDFTLVDPDNRRPVDFAHRARLLADLQARSGGTASAAGDGPGPVAPGGDDPAAQPVPPGLLAELLAHWPDGRIKLLVTHRALVVRRAQRELFLEGDYQPLAGIGRRAEHICAFARRLGSRWAVAVAPRLPSALTAPGTFPLGAAVWADDTLPLPRGAPQRWRDALTGSALTAAGGGAGPAVPLAAVFERLPVALLIAG